MRLRVCVWVAGRRLVAGVAALIPPVIHQVARLTMDWCVDCDAERRGPLDCVAIATEHG